MAVHLHAELADEESVQHVVGRHDQLDRLVSRHVQLVVADPVGMPELPVPLLRANRGLVGVVRRRAQVDEYLEAPPEHDAHQHHRNARPDQLKRGVVLRPTDEAKWMNVGPTSELKPEGQVATPEEARQAILGLCAADFAKLMLIAKGFVRKRMRSTVIEPEDLLHDAIAKTLDGRRKWRKSVSILKHLDRIIESDSGHVAEQIQAHRNVPMPEGDQEIVECGSGPGAAIELSEAFERLLRHFEGDRIAMEILRLKGDGLAASEIQRELGMSKTQYETATRRIRRHVAQHLHTEADGHER